MRPDVFTEAEQAFRSASYATLPLYKGDERNAVFTMGGDLAFALHFNGWNETAIPITRSSLLKIRQQLAPVKKEHLAFSIRVYRDAPMERVSVWFTAASLGDLACFFVCLEGQQVHLK